MSTVADEATLERPVHDTPPAGRRSLDADGFPTSRDERWSYTPIGDVLARLPSTSVSVAAAVSRDLVDTEVGHHGSVRLVFVDGHFVDELSDRADVTGLWCGPASEIPVELESELAAVQARAAELEPAEGFDHLNRSADHDVAVVIALPGAVTDDAVHIVQFHVSDDQLSNPRTVIAAGVGSRVHVIESFVGTSTTGFTNAVTFASVGENAELIHHRIQHEQNTAVHLGRTMFDQAAHSRVETAAITLGADISRHGIDVIQRGDHATSSIDGLYVPVGSERHDTVITVDHAASHGTSTQRFSGVIDDRAHGSFTGHVVVRPGTRANNARQSNRNLLLTSTAQVNTRPWLEIFADEVQCTHGATVGRLDAEALFYLRSRGIPRLTARSMLVEAFIAEIVDTITPDSLRDQVRSVIANLRDEVHS